MPRSGAARGLGFTFLILGGILVSGAELIAKISKLEEVIKQAHLVITGEGQSDSQTLNGKTPDFIADLSNKHDVPVILISGALQSNSELLRRKFSGCFSIINQPSTLFECISNAEDLLLEQTK